MKKNATRYCAGPAYYRMCSTDVYCLNKPAAVQPKETITHHFFVSGIGQKKTVDAAKICGGAENVVKTETQQTFVNGLLGFITFRHLYSAGSACVLLTIIAWVAHRYGQLYLHCSLIYFWVPSSCFCIVISLFWGWNNPVQRCLPVGEAALSTPEAVVASRTDWQTALMCNRRRPAATSSRRASFSALASANSFVYFASSAANIIDASAMSVIAAFASFSSLAFLSRWAL